MSRTHFLQNPSPFPNLHGLSSQSLSLHSSNHSDELRSTTDFSPSLVSDRLHLDWLEHSDVEEKMVLKVSFDEEFRGLIRWWFCSVEGWVVSHVIGYSAVTESLRADDRVRLLGKEMGLCGVEMGLDEADA
ncbi:hypothetical protein V6N13_142531 [Hibiscus sabdariffa]